MTTRTPDPDPTPKQSKWEDRFDNPKWTMSVSVLIVSSLLIAAFFGISVFLMTAALAFAVAISVGKIEITEQEPLQIPDDPRELFE